VIVIVTFTVGLVIWVVGWAMGLKAFDVFLLTVLMTVTAAAIRITIPYLNQWLGRERLDPGDQQGPPRPPGFEQA
jgi:hypothetical protein